MFQTAFESMPQRAGAITVLPRQPENILVWRLAQILREYHGPVLCLVPDAQQAKRLRQQLANAFQVDTMDLPAWDTLPFERSALSQEVITARLRACYGLIFKRAKVFATLPAFVQRVVPQNFLINEMVDLKVGERIDPVAFRNRLAQAGYQSVSRLSGVKQYRSVGGQIDFVLANSDESIRVEWCDDRIERLTCFPQAGCGSVIDAFERIPKREFPTDHSAKTQFEQQWRTHCSRIPASDAKPFKNISGQGSEGLEYWSSLFFSADPMPNLVDFLPAEGLIILVGEIFQAYAKHWEWLESFYRRGTSQPSFMPMRSVWESCENFQSALKRSKVIGFGDPGTGFASDSAQTSATYLSVEQFQAEQLDRLGGWAAWLNWALGEGYRIWVTVSTASEAEAVQRYLIEASLEWIEVQTIFSCEADTKVGVGRIGVLWDVERLPGYICLSEKFAWLTYSDLLTPSTGAEPTHLADASVVQTPRPLNGQWSDWEPGLLVVHLKYGIGRYEGLLSLASRAGEVPQEYLKITYAQEAVLYVPVYEWHFLSRYTYLSNVEETVPLHALDGRAWQDQRKKVIEQANDAAAQLLVQHARRTVAKGVAFRLVEAYAAFSQLCGFEETADQRLAINAVIQDLQSPKPMDRLICGDVGFGKTEIALRAAFIVAKNGKQVIVLAPTTLLAEQHYCRFRDRLAPWQLNVQMISRFTSQRAKRAILAELQAGTAHVLVVTHQLFHLNRETFKDLGLLIIDEEQRFGVAQKELVRQLDPGVDRLALTATPIPRTLSMVLSDLRSVSLIASPPKSRKPVKTCVGVYDPQICMDAIRRELNRGGQVYYVYNRVLSIESVAARLRKLIPGLRLAIAHGQMNSAALEETMMGFYQHEYDLLLSSSIIETGLDVPNVNTLIVEQAERLGLSQLHQLRGRVGRSERQAYAYLFCDNQQSFGSRAGQRLRVLSEYQGLGSGFALASQDLELRGCGDLLGHRQSGKNPITGVPLYLKMVEEAAAYLKEGKNPYEMISMECHATLDLGVTAALPTTYLPDLEMRLKWYERLGAISDRKALEGLQAEIVASHGTLPLVAQQLFDLAHLRLIMKQLGIQLLRFNAQQGALHFHETTGIRLEAILSLIQHGWQQNPKIRFRLKPDGMLLFETATHEATQRIQLAKALLEYFVEYRFKERHHAEAC